MLCQVRLSYVVIIDIMSCLFSEIFDFFMGSMFIIVASFSMKFRLIVGNKLGLVIYF